MIDPMSSKPLPLARAAAAVAASASFAAVVFARSFFFSLQKPLCPGQAAIWHAVLQYATDEQPAHVLNVTPFLGLSPHAPHKAIVSSGCVVFCCVDDDDDDDNEGEEDMMADALPLCFICLRFALIREKLNSNSADSCLLSSSFCRLFTLSFIYLSSLLTPNC